MAITQLTTLYPGNIGVNPRWVSLLTTDTLATMETAGYLDSYMRESGFVVYPTDFIACSYVVAGVTAWQIFNITFSNGVSTLQATNAAGDVTLPVTSGDLAIFSGTTGLIADANIAANKVINFSGSLTTGHILSTSGTAGVVVDGGLATNTLLTSAIATPDVSIDLVAFDVIVGEAALASAGKVNLIVSSGSKQYKIRSLQMNVVGTNFSGGSGDRLLAITDGTTVYSVIPAANLQTLVNAQWGATALPNPATASINTSTVAGANLYAQYSGGTTDYTAGSVVISGIAQRVV